MRRGHLTAVASCLAGAAVTLYAATRVWAVQVEPRPGLSDLRTEQTGSDAQPWLIGLAVVALAGTGALLATRGLARRLLGVLLALAGAGIVVGAVLARTGIDPGVAGLSGLAWPVVCVLGGAAVAVGGVLAARNGHLWPAMSSRYDRRPAAPTSVPAQPDSAQPYPAQPDPAQPDPDQLDPTQPDPDQPGPVPERVQAAPSSREFWDALDRGDDPTAR